MEEKLATTKTIMCLGGSSLGTASDRIFIAVNSHHDHGDSYKGHDTIEAGFKFQNLEHYRHGGRRSDVCTHGAGWRRS